MTDLERLADKPSHGVPLRLVLWGTYDLSKPRTRMLRDFLVEHSDVTEIHNDIWAGVDDKSSLQGIWPKIGALMRWIGAYPGLLWRYLWAAKHEAVVVLYLGHLDVLLLWPLARLRGIPIVWDVVLTLGDTLVDDRRMVPSGGLAARLIAWWDWLALRAATRVVLLTRAKRNRLEHLHGINYERFRIVPLAAESSEFFPMPPRTLAESDCLRVLFYGQFAPMHGLDRVIEAACQMPAVPIHWRFIGTGQEAWRLREWIARDSPGNVSWSEWIPYGELRDEIAEADLCLGFFGDSEKARVAIPNKVLQVLAVGRALATRDTPGMRELFGDAPRRGIYLVDGGAPEALLEVLSRAWKERDILRRGLQYTDITAGRTAEASGADMLAVIREVVSARAAGG